MSFCFSGLNYYKALFSDSVVGFLTKYGLHLNIEQDFITICVSKLTLMTLDSTVYIERMSLQEFFYEEGV